MTSFTSSLKDNWLPDIGDCVSARRVALQGFAAAILQVGAALVFAARTSFRTSFGGLGTATFLIAAVMFGAVAIGIWRLSRGAAVAGLVFFLLNLIWLLLTSHTLTDIAGTIVLTILFALLLVNGIRGTFACHRLLVEERSSRPGKDEEQAV